MCGRCRWLVSIVSGVVTVAVVMSSTAACSTGGDDTADASLSSFVERVVRDEEAPPFAQYFSLERYRASTELPEGLTEEELVSEVFFEAQAEAMIVDPYLTMIKLSRADPIVVPLGPLDASYSSFDDSGSVLVGDFDPEAIRTAMDDLGGEVTETETAIGPSFVIADDDKDDGVDTGDFQMDDFYAGTSVLVADGGGQVVFDAEGDGSGAFAGDGDATAADQEGIPEVASALDAKNVYAAALFFDGGGTAEAGDALLAAPWTRAGLGTAIEDGQNRAVMTLWHGEKDAAEANAEVAGELLGELADCTDQPEVDREDRLVIATCAVEEAGFVRQTLSRVPIGPLFD